MLRADDNFDHEDRIADLERELRISLSRQRILEARLQARAVSLGDFRGKIRTLRLGPGNTLEVR